VQPALLAELYGVFVLLSGSYFAFHSSEVKVILANSMLL
jgi:hypothetical protein